MDTVSAPTEVSRASCCNDGPALPAAINAKTSRSGGSEAPLGRAWFGWLAYWLRDRRVMIGVAAVVVTAAVWFNWGWLAAIGAAPLILALAPCAAMCAVGLCAKGSGKTTSGKDVAGRKASDETAPPSVG